LNDAVIAAMSSASILDAMKLMSEQGVSSVAILEENSGTLLSAVSVTDIGKIVVPSESNQILATPLHYFISQIKEPDGLTDGADKYPVYSVFPSSLLSYTIDKILATNAHRVFVTKESGPTSPILSPAFHGIHGNLTGIVSIVDILSLFALSAKITNVDPGQMQRRRRASSSSQSSISDRDIFNRSRSNSRASTRRSSIVFASSPPGISPMDSARNPVPVFALDPLSVQRQNNRRSVNLKKHSAV
jgi:CBS domain-containing protein